MMTKIIWVKGGLVGNDRLAAAIENVPSKKCLIVKVESVQEAICELFEGEGEVALIICDRVLDMSMPQQELYAIARDKKIPYLLAGETALYKSAKKTISQNTALYETQRFRRCTVSIISQLLAQLPIKELRDPDMCGVVPVFGEHAG